VKALLIIFLACAIFGAAGFFTYELFVRPQRELAEEKAAPATPAPPDSTLPQFNKCVALKEKGKLIEARKAFEDFLDHHPESSKAEDARDLLGEINTTIFLTPIPAPEKQLYVVRSGDVLNRVANKTKTTPELIMKGNNLTGTMLKIDQKLYTSPSNFSLVISRKRSKVILSNNGKFFKQYPILEVPPALQAKPKKAAPGKQTGKVTEKMAWHNGSRVIFSDPGYSEATHWININIAHCTLYGALPEGIDPKTASKPPSGIAIPPTAAVELATMLSRGTPVTLE
jgi:LysM repeat protein